jgi:hypothetical protein
MTTISIELDDELLARLRALGAAQNLTLEQMAQRLLDVRTAPPPVPEELGPLTRAATGMAPPMTDEDVRRVLDEERTRKYGGR